MVCEGEPFVVVELPLLFESGKMLRFINTVIVVNWSFVSFDSILHNITWFDFIIIVVISVPSLSSNLREIFLAASCGKSSSVDTLRCIFLFSFFYFFFIFLLG